MTDLTIQMAQTQTIETTKESKIQELENKIKALETEIEELKYNPLSYDGTVYRDKKDHPYCPTCYDTHGQKVHLHKPISGRNCYYCQACNAKYFEK